MNPTAKNYNPLATVDDGSCVYLVEIDGECLQFEDLPNQEDLIDHSFTLSYSIPQKNWVFFHDYLPDYYTNTRTNLFNFKNSKVFQNNKGPRGLYHDSVRPFFVDVVFKDKETFLLNTLNWISEIRDSGNKLVDDNEIALSSETITAITIWNNFQTSGRILLNRNNPPLKNVNNRNVHENWSFNKFRDLALENTEFIDTLFKNFAILPQGLASNPPWYKQKVMKGKYFIVRFEFDNYMNKQLTLHDVDITLNPTYR